MKVSINWLKEFVNVEESLTELAEQFTIKSQEVESIGPLVDAADLIVGYVVSCDPHPDAKKLSVCTVDTKDAVRTIVCGAPNVAKGQRVIVALPGATLSNGLTIEKTTIRGVASEGMICSLEELGIPHKYHNEDGIHVIEDDVEVGSDALEALALTDAVLELDLTPNRADLLSVIGVAYDYGAMTKQTVRVPEVSLHTNKSKKNPMTITTDTKNCFSYYGRVIDDLTIKPSPAWMRARLIAAGIRPINNVVDITNYVMMETGQPLHAFDYELLNSDTILVRDAHEGETFVTLDDKTRRLKAGDIVITNGKNPVALGGVMGGAETEVQSTTKSILLESAHFHPRNIRRTSHRLDLRSESSMRFERGIDPEMTRYALDRASALFVKYASATVRDGVSYFDYNEAQTTTIDVPITTLNRVLGSDFTVDFVGDILNRLHLKYVVKEGVFSIMKPSRRGDFETYQDIVEEVGRIAGYDALPHTLPKTVSQGGLSPTQQRLRTIRRTLCGLGLNEVITYSLRDSETLKEYCRDLSLTPVSVKHPMSEMRETLSLTPLNGLLDVARYNKARKQNPIHVFEIGTSYHTHGEERVLGVLMQGVYPDKKWKGQDQADFFTIKGVLEALLDAMGIESVSYERVALENYHPHQTALIKYDDKILGHIGKLHPKQASALDLDDVYLLELNLDDTMKFAKDVVRYEPLQKYPGVERDIALVVSETTSAEKIIESIKATGNDTLVSVDVFDVYSGKHLETGKKSLGLRMQFQDAAKTLKATDVDDDVERIVAVLKEEYGATLR